MTLYIPAAMVGLGGAVALPDLANPDIIFPEMLFRYAPAWLTGIVLAGRPLPLCRHSIRFCIRT